MNDRERVSFKSGKVNLHGYLYLPGGSELRPVPCVVLAHGFSGTMDRLTAHPTHFADGGIAALIFDYRNFGESDCEPRHLVEIAGQQVLGHSRCVACGGDFGGVVVQGLALRQPAMVERAVLFNTIPPFLFEDYERAGVEPVDFTQLDHFARHGQRADDLLRGLDSPAGRREYVAEVYGEAGWAGPEAFSGEEQAFMTEPFADENAFRTSIRLYEYAFGRPPSATARLFEPNPTETLVLYGPEDAVVPAAFVACMSVAFPNVVGPYGVTGAGHFVQWEQAALFNRTLEWFCRDLLLSR